MIIGNGQIATIFKNDVDQGKYKNVCIFASGVSNSGCQEEKEFKREERLLLKKLAENKENKFIYFSSCALSATDYPRNEYYNHKAKMEQLIRERSNDHLICRVPQLFGEFKKHNTLINFLYDSIVCGKNFIVYSEAYRYVVDIADLKAFIDKYISVGTRNKTIDFGNPYRYSILELITTLESALNKKGSYTILSKTDAYYLEFTDALHFCLTNNLDFSFGINYFENKINFK